MRIGETHPTEPVSIGVKRIKPSNRAIGNPVGVIPLARNVVDVSLRGTGIAAAFSTYLQRHIKNAVIHRYCFGVVLHEPLGVMERTHAAVTR